MRRVACLAAVLACAALASASAAQAQARAAGCRRADASRTFGLPGTTERWEDLRHGAVFRCTLRAGGPERRVVLVGGRDEGEPEAVRIEGPGGTQRFDLHRGNTPPPAGSPFFRAEDLNGDGWTDLQVLLSSGAQGQRWYAVFRYSPASGRFVKDETLSGGGNLERLSRRGCVRSTAYYVDRLNRDEDCWRGGRWVNVRSEKGENIGPGVWVTVRRARVGGRMRVVSVDTTRGGG